MSVEVGGNRTVYIDRRWKINRRNLSNSLICTVPRKNSSVA